MQTHFDKGKNLGMIPCKDTKALVKWYCFNLRFSKKLKSQCWKVKHSGQTLAEMLKSSRSCLMVSSGLVTVWPIVRGSSKICWSLPPAKTNSSSVISEQGTYSESLKSELVQISDTQISSGFHTPCQNMNWLAQTVLNTYI